METLPGSSTKLHAIYPAESLATQKTMSESSPLQKKNGSSPTGVQGITTKSHEISKEPHVLNRSAETFREWKTLQRRIRAHAAIVSKKEWEVQEGINTYRMVISGVSFKPLKLDQEIWDLYQLVLNQVPVLTQKTLKAPLYLQNIHKLRKYEANWSELVGQQDRLLETLDKAPKSVEFYNRIHLARIRKLEQESQDAEIGRRNAQARETIEKALNQFGMGNEKTGLASLGSTVLRLEDARQYWSERLNEISVLESSSRMDPDELITIFRNLEDTITDAPAMAERVKEVEVGFIRLMTMNEELSTYGKTVIPSEDLARMLITMQDEVPKLWATGSWDKLQRLLSEVGSFVKFYELPVRSELSLAERRKPSMTKAVLTGANVLPISQATPLIRSLVNAIDSRDRYMRGHSDTVARLSVQIARKMNWNNDDIELLEVASLLHDVGKIAIPEQVLNKTEPLTPDEWKTIQMHPYHGARIAKSLESLSQIIPWIYHHQERWDGGGYPDGISAAAIPNAARVIALGEAYTVMITDQPKRRAMSIDQAIDEVKKGAGTQFDPEVVEAFSDTVNSARSESARQAKSE